MANKLTGVSAIEKRFWRALEQRDIAALKEIRATDMEAGTQTLAYTEGSLGGYLVPQDFEQDIIFGMAQVDPLLDKKVVTLIKTKGARPLTYPGWDLSTLAATRLAEGTQQNPGVVPAVSAINLNGAIYVSSLDATMELEEDAFEPIVNAMKDAFGVALARGIGVDLITGAGTPGIPQGILTGATASGVTLDQTITSDVSATLNDAFQEAYFSINRIYRNSKKCAWIMNDETYEWIRQLTDKQARPLIEIRKDKEEIMGKPVLISPTMPAYNASPLVHGKIVFGDLSHYVVRTSQVTLMRRTDLPGYAEFGKALYTARMRADGRVHDPTNGVTPPIVFITINP